MVLQHGAKGINQISGNRNELYPSQTDVFNSKSNFTHYEDNLLANNKSSKSKKSIEVGSNKNILPSQSQLCTT